MKPRLGTRDRKHIQALKARHCAPLLALPPSHLAYRPSDDIAPSPTPCDPAIPIIPPYWLVRGTWKLTDPICHAHPVARTKRSPLVTSHPLKPYSSAYWSSLPDRAYYQHQHIVSTVLFITSNSVRARTHSHSKRMPCCAQPSQGTPW